MNAKNLMIAAGALLLCAPLAAMAAETPSAPGGGTPAAGGKGPGMGHDYRRNVGGPGLGPMTHPAARPAAPRAPEPPTPPASLRDAPPVAPLPPAGPGYRGYPGPGVAVPYGNPGPGALVPRRQGYGYPGYRGHGWSPYPGHHQYGNPPGYPPAPQPQPPAGQ